MPTLFALHAGQIGPLLLLGAVLFLVAMKKNSPFLAGLATVLLAVKPHLAYLVGLAILFDAIFRKREGIVLALRGLRRGQPSAGECRHRQQGLRQSRKAEAERLAPAEMGAAAYGRSHARTRGFMQRDSLIGHGASALFRVDPLPPTLLPATGIL